MSGDDRYPRRYGDGRRSGGSRSLGVYSSGVGKKYESGGGGYRDGGGRGSYGSGRGRGHGGRGRRNKNEPTPTKEDLDADLDNWRLKDKKTGGEMLDKDLDSYKQEKGTEEKQPVKVVDTEAKGDIPAEQAVTTEQSKVDEEKGEEK